MIQGIFRWISTIFCLTQRGPSQHKEAHNNIWQSRPVVLWPYSHVHSEAFTLQIGVHNIEGCNKDLKDLQNRKAFSNNADLSSTTVFPYYAFSLVSHAMRERPCFNFEIDFFYSFHLLQPEENDGKM